MTSGLRYATGSVGKENRTFRLDLGLELLSTFPFAIPPLSSRAAYAMVRYAIETTDTDDGDDGVSSVNDGD